MLNQTATSDAQVREDVLRELRLDSRLEGAKIGVAVSDGSVTLTGTLGSTTETLLAVEAGRRGGGGGERRGRGGGGGRGLYNLTGGAPPVATAENVREAVGAALRR